MIGTQLGSYRIESLLGRGGMGAVYRALDVEGGERVALKVLAADDALDPVAAERFQAEAKLLASLNHPNIVAARAALQHERGHAFYAMELVRGKSLARVLGERGHLRPEEAVTITLEVLAGLGAAHERGVIHRDVKPANVIVASGGAVKVVDFGLARALDATRLTLSGQALGTPCYMSPEQAEAKSTDARTDVYSVGVLLYELLTGKPPFVAEAPLALLKQHVESPVPPLTVPLPAGLEGALRRALAKNPERRFATAGEFASALRSLSPGRVDAAALAEIVGSAETASSVISEMAETPARPISRRKRRWVVASLLTFLVGISAPAWYSRLRPPAERVVVLHKLSGETVEGRLVTINDNEARLKTADGRELVVPRNEIVEIGYR